MNTWERERERGGIKSNPLPLNFTGALEVTKGIITVNIWEHVINK